MSVEDKTSKTDEVEGLIKIATAEIIVERDMLKEELNRKEKEIEDLKGALARAKDHIESETKSKLIGELKKITNYGDEYLYGLNVEQLRQLQEDYKYVKLPKFKSSADLGSKVDFHEKLHNMYKFGRKE